MARTLKFIFRRQPAWGAPEMGTFRKQGIETGFFPHDPDPKLLFEFFIDLAEDIIVGISRFKPARWLKENPREG